MFRPAQDSMNRVMGYSVNRSAIHGMGMMMRMEEHQQMMLQMQEMEMMQMQAHGGIPYGQDGMWMNQQQPMMPMDGQQQQTMPPQEQPMTAPQMQNAQGFPAVPELPQVHGKEDRKAPGSASPAATAANARSPALKTTTPSTAAGVTAGGAAEQPSQVGGFSAYGGNSLYNALPTDNGATGSTVNSNGGSVYGGNSLYGDDMALPSIDPGPHSLYDRSNPNNMYGAPTSMAAPGDSAAKAEKAISPASQGKRLTTGMNHKPVTPVTETNASDRGAAPVTTPDTGADEALPTLQNRLSSAAGARPPSSLPELQRKSSLALRTRSSSNLSSHRSREIRQKNSELKRQNSGMSSGNAARPFDRKASSSSLHDKEKQKDKRETKDSKRSASSKSSGKEHHKKRSSSVSSSKSRERERHHAS
ncbi:hypothetical protein ABL78_3411 [Leptomonas seymouri]|uniref:Uncharacterized protein n=1 Tax=Leptomonas seymouri TaxID=5684 RepID=A0A0N1ILC0_LEPSE|nr:hypothetical protein ABL78_3411 [Leptomonas seymouri]|eukprot:KPI87500.1 hypothetical protein ABL78_3411 [Leptomonas seymouri]